MFKSDININIASNNTNNNINEPLIIINNINYSAGNIYSKVINNYYQQPVMFK